LINEFWDKGKWVGVSDSPCVDQAIVLYGAEVAVFLFDVEESSLVRAFRWSDRPSSEVFFDELPEFL
jgi:hypothetical protein